MNDETRVRFLMATALMLAMAAMLAGPAGARPIEGTELSSAGLQTVRPDDKGGMLGVGAISAPQLVVPYLSQGLGVDESQFTGTPQSTGAQAAPTSDDGGGNEASIFGAAMAGLLLAGMALLAMRRRHSDGNVAT